jgi:hypothetical protein
LTIDPYKWLARTPLHLHFDTLPEHEMGRWIPGANAIVLDRGLSQAERRCTLVHELVHRMHGDDPDLPPDLLAAQERECEKRTAKLLIPLAKLLDALLWCHEEHEEELAEILWVDVPTLRDRIRHLTEKERGFMLRRLAQSRNEA